ncbi:hypothetical protein AW008_13960 [Shigella sonnei]|nr:hypothetical protein [Escherichia coli]OCC69071.1 hypothetical protein AW008_13960 [Shigella sonnei]KYT02321.1 hypothetical protein AML35_00010 [Escherichia coli]OCC77449.1 hypothetical protein AW000_20365 [Shigella sonnei]OCD18539.1 hypothetical protein AWZ92_19055 [Shigella sonnei]
MITLMMCLLFLSPLVIMVIICNVKIILVVHTYKIEVQYLKGYGAGMLMVLEQPIENLMVYV